MTLNGIMRHVVVAALLIAAAGCGDVTGPDDVAGAYEATTFIVTSEGWTFNAVDADEFSFLLNLRTDGTTAGYFYVPRPASGEGIGADTDLSGTWELNGRTVTLQFQFMSLLDQLEYSVVGNTLVADGIIGDDLRLSIVLKQK